MLETRHNGNLIHERNITSLCTKIRLMQARLRREALDKPFFGLNLSRPNRKNRQMLTMKKDDVIIKKNDSEIIIPTFLRNEFV